MAGGHMKYRGLSRSSSHRQALLRNLVTSLFKHESITTTWHKAKEAQSLAEKMITLGKKNTEATRRRAHQIFYSPHEMVPKLFGPIRERYLDRPGGYTRILRIEPVKEDQAESAILELVDGPRDMRFAMTAKTLSNLPEHKQINEITARNVKKITQFRKDGISELRNMVEKMRGHKKQGWDDRTELAPKRVYLLEDRHRREMHYPEEVDDWERPNRFVRQKEEEVPARKPMYELKETLEKKKRGELEDERWEAAERRKGQTVLAPPS
ncbi:ribosomal protein L17 [Byssothecium circinans]|uniref:Large ribosomal subunit protein bL17m n=1 Tax=Byssothecium circinans TaxID=147558 RepID=A0A6A5TT95_9PLEO|nr:ribosomal protein L17 [Byssothecium circinans]